MIDMKQCMRERFLASGARGHRFESCRAYHSPHLESITYGQAPPVCRASESLPLAYFPASFDQLLTSRVIFAVILAICFLSTPGRAEAVSVLQRTTELRTPPVFANCDDPGSGVQRDTTHKGPVGAEPEVLLPGESQGTGPRSEPAGTFAEADAQKSKSATRPTVIGVNAGIGWGDLAAPVSIPRYWKFSVVALAGGSALDSASSWQQYEANPLLRGADGRFGDRGLVIKSGVVIGLVAIQYIVVRRCPKAAKIFAVVNFSMGATYTGVAVRNWRME